jgi:hypothetical protein
MAHIDLTDPDAMDALFDEIEIERPGFRARVEANIAARKAAERTQPNPGPVPPNPFGGWGGESSTNG